MKDKKMNRTWTQYSGSLEFNEEDQTLTGSALVFQGYCNKVAETNLFSHVLEAGHPKLRCEQVHSPLEASRGRSSLALSASHNPRHSLAYSSIIVIFAFIFMWSSFHMNICVSVSSLHIRTPIQH